MLKKIKEDWGSPSTDSQLKLLIMDADYWLKASNKLTLYYSFQSKDSFGEWMNNLHLNFTNDAYRIAQFREIQIVEMHKNLLNLLN
jgi:hypothetical protein